MAGVVNLGELNVRLAIQQFTTVNHAVNNQEVKTWTALKTIWVKELARSSEGFENNQQVAVDEVRFLARWSSVFNPATGAQVVNEKMRCVRRSETLYINSIESTGQREYAIIRATKRNNG